MTIKSPNTAKTIAIALSQIDLIFVKKLGVQERFLSFLNSQIFCARMIQVLFRCRRECLAEECRQIASSMVRTGQRFQSEIMFLYFFLTVFKVQREILYLMALIIYSNYSPSLSYSSFKNRAALYYSFRIAYSRYFLAFTSSPLLRLTIFLQSERMYRVFGILTIEQLNSIINKNIPQQYPKAFSKSVLENSPGQKKYIATRTKTPAIIIQRQNQPFEMSDLFNLSKLVNAPQSYHPWTNGTIVHVSIYTTQYIHRYADETFFLFSQKSGSCQQQEKQISMGTRRMRPKFMIQVRTETR